MIEWFFEPRDLARVRFAFSPVWEAVLSLIVLRDPSRHALHVPWIRTARSGLGDVDLSELFALIPISGITADFLCPPPPTPLPSLEEELATIRNTPAHRIVADLRDVNGIAHDTIKGIRDDPTAAAARLADTLEAYWNAVLAEHWPRLRGLLEADVLWRSRRLARGGAADLFADLHETITWHGDRLTVSDPWNYRGPVSGDGLLLVPTAFSWPGVRKLIAPYQATLSYPVRGIGTLWETAPAAAPAALGELIGRTRAQLLIQLAGPESTTDLALRLGITPSAVSQHLSVLRANGLVTATRVGPAVLYQRTSRGEALVG